MKGAWMLQCVALGLLLTGPCVHAQADDYEDQIQRVLQAIYTVDDPGADAALRDLEVMRPGFPAPLVYRELLDSWRAGDDPLNQALIKTFDADADKAIDASLKWTHDHPADAEGWRYLASAYGQRTRFAERVEFKHTNAARYGLKTRKAADTAYSLDKSNPDILVGVGGAHFFAAHLPYTLRFFAWLLGIHGDRNAGLRELTRATQEGKHSRVEGAMVLAGAYWTENDYNDFQSTVTDVASHYPRLLSVRTWQVEGWICSKQLSSPQIDDAIGQAEAGDAWKSLQRGRIALARGDSQRSIELFSQALLSPDANFSVKALACNGIERVGSNQRLNPSCPKLSGSSELYSRTFPMPGKCRH